MYLCRKEKYDFVATVMHILIKNVRIKRKKEKKTSLPIRKTITKNEKCRFVAVVAFAACRRVFSASRDG